MLCLTGKQEGLDAPELDNAHNEPAKLKWTPLQSTTGYHVQYREVTSWIYCGTAEKQEIIFTDVDRTKRWYLFRIVPVTGEVPGNPSDATRWPVGELSFGVRCLYGRLWT